MEAKMSSCQITGIPKEVWRSFRRLCLEEGISANRKLVQVIEAMVMEALDGTIEERKYTTNNSTDRD